MLPHLKLHHIMWLIFLFCLILIAFGIARAKPLDSVGDDPPIPEWWKPFTYNPNIPLREDLQCILWNACLENDVPLEYALAIIETESGFQPDADSGVAHGLMQLHKYYYDPAMPPGENILAGAKLLGDNFERCGNWPSAITSYAVGHDDGSRGYWGIIAKRAEKWKEVLQCT